MRWMLLEELLVSSYALWYNLQSRNLSFQLDPRTIALESNGCLVRRRISNMNLGALGQKGTIYGCALCVLVRPQGYPPLPPQGVGGLSKIPL